MNIRMRKGSGEGLWWLFMRVSAFLMPVMVLVHLLIQHLVNDVHDLTAEWVAERWRNGGWRVYDGIMLILAVIHGLRGTTHVIDDTIHDPARNRAARMAVTVLGMAVVGAGLAGLISFDSDTTLEELEG